MKKCGVAGALFPQIQYRNVPIQLSAPISLFLENLMAVSDAYVLETTCVPEHFVQLQCFVSLACNTGQTGILIMCSVCALGKHFSGYAWHR